MKLRQSISNSIYNNTFLPISPAYSTEKKFKLSPVIMFFFFLINVFINHSKPDSYQIQWEYNKCKKHQKQNIAQYSQKKKWIVMLIHEKNWLFPENGKLRYASLKLMCSPGFSFYTVLIEKRLGMLSNSPVPNSFCSQIILFWGSEVTDH